MASRAFLLLALAFTVALLIASEVAAAKELASDNYSEVNESGHGSYNNGGGRGGYKNGGGSGGHDDVGGRPSYQGFCRKTCCGHGPGGRCSTSAEATTYKQTQN